MSLRESHKILSLNTIAFTISFACWTLNGVLITFLVDNGLFNWSIVETGWLLGMPILSGAVLRLPVGILTDKYGGKPVFIGVLLLSALGLFMMYFANTYLSFMLFSLLFGTVGTTFSVGIAYTSVWYPKEWQGRALGIFGMGNAGAALTTFIAPSLLKHFSVVDSVNGWRWIPIIYGVTLMLMVVLFMLFTKNKKAEAKSKTLSQQLSTLKNIRVWRFGLYYFLVFGLFVAFSQWLVPYYVNVYHVSLITAGLFASFFSLPSGVIRAFGGYLSDKFGARKVMYFVIISSVVIGAFLILPKMEIYTPGKGIIAPKKGTITKVSADKFYLNDKEFKILEKPDITFEERLFPKTFSWQEVVVTENQQVNKKELLAEGKTVVLFEANIWMFTILVVFIGAVWGIGKAAVYKHIPEYFPNEIGIVGGMVGLIGGLGGFVGSILFGYLLNFTGLWTSSWMFVLVISAIALLWMNQVIKKMNHRAAPQIKDKIEHKNE